MHSSLVVSLLLLSCLSVAISVTAQEYEYETSQFRHGESFFARFPNNTVLISVNGESRVEIPAVYAEISATVESMYTNTTTGAVLTDVASVIRDVSERTARAMTRVIELLKSTPNVTKLTTTQVSLQPIYNWTSGFQVLVGYRAINSISFRVDLPSAPSVLDSIVRAGISRIDSVSYAASNQDIMMARTRAIQDSIKDAQMQVMAMTAVIPTTAIPEIYMIDMISASPPSPVSLPRLTYRSGYTEPLMMAPQPIVGGSLELVARAAVRFMVKKDAPSRFIR